MPHALPMAQVAPGDYVPSADGRVVMHRIPWAHFEAILALRGERSSPRIAYLEGALELMSPSRHHERIKAVLGSLVVVFAEERGLSLSSYGGWTLRHAPGESAVEPDDCFILGSDQSRERPDLAIEVEWTHGGIDRLEIYRRLRVPEVWWWREGRVTVHALEGDRYIQSEASLVLGGFPMAHALELLDAPNLTDAIRAFRAALRG
jgi:Uma2 family endonuclease